MNKHLILNENAIEFYWMQKALRVYRKPKKQVVEDLEDKLGLEIYGWPETELKANEKW